MISRPRITRMSSKCDDARFFISYFVLCALHQAQNSSNSQVTQVSCFHHQSSGNRRRRSRSITTALDDYRDRQLRFLERRDAQEPSVNARMLFVHNDLFVLADRKSVV